GARGGVGRGAARARSGLGAASRVALVVTSLLAAACASTPHPPTGMMWGYIGKSTDPPTLEIVGYAPDRPSCEFSRAMGQTRSGVPVPSQRSDQCQPLDPPPPPPPPPPLPPPPPPAP